MEIWIFLGGYSVTSDLDLGKKVGNLDFGGVFCNFGFGLRKKSWKFGIEGGYSVTSDLDLGKKVGNLDFGGVFCNFGFGLRKKVGNLDLGGYSVTSDLDLGKKVGNLEFWGGYSVTSDLDLGKKVGKLDFLGGYSVTSDLDLGKKKVGNLGGGVFCKGDGKRKKPTLQKNLPDQFGIIPKSPIPSGLPNQC